jgi:hypothetical protein
MSLQTTTKGKLMKFGVTFVRNFLDFLGKLKTKKKIKFN